MYCFVGAYVVEGAFLWTLGNRSGQMKYLLLLFSPSVGSYGKVNLCLVGHQNNNNDNIACLFLSLP